MAEPQAKLVRKHYLLSQDNIDKVEQLAEAEKCSAAEVVRKAIEAYAADHDDAALDALLDAVESSIADAVKSTKATNRKVERLLKGLDG